MGNVIDGLEARYNELPADLVDDAIRAFTLIAERHGGRMIRGKYQLTAKVKKRYERKGSAWVLMTGVPSGFWTWREYGTEPHVIAPKKRRRGGRKRRNWKPGPMGGALADVAGHPIWKAVHHPGIASPPRSWTKTVEEADRVITAMTERALEQMG